MDRKFDLRVLLYAVFLAVLSGVAVTGLLTGSRTIPSEGIIKGINVEGYWDAGCTQNVTVNDWGAPEPGEVVYKTIYVKNGGNSPLTLNMTASDWTPSAAENYLTLAWDREGATVGAGEVVQAVLSLDVSGAITGINAFSFNMVIEGTG